MEIRDYDELQSRLNDFLASKGKEGGIASLDNQGNVVESNRNTIDVPIGRYGRERYGRCRYAYRYGVYGYDYYGHCKYY